MLSRSVQVAAGRSLTRADAARAARLAQRRLNGAMLSAVRLRSTSSGSRSALPDPEHAGSHHEQDEASLLVRESLSPRGRGGGSGAAASAAAPAGDAPASPLADVAEAFGGAGPASSPQLQVMGLDVTPELCAIAMGARRLAAGRPRERGNNRPRRRPRPARAWSTARGHSASWGQARLRGSCAPRAALCRARAPPCRAGAAPSPPRPNPQPQRHPPPVYFVQGILGLSRLALSFYFKDDLHVDPAQVAVLTGIAGIPWCA
jgi:hypothetical protein